MIETETRNQAHGYGALLADGGFQSFLWTQFLGAFNDNVYKMIVSVGAVEFAANRLLGARYLALAGAVFVLPFLLFAGYAGQIADRFSKTRVLQITKAFEIAIMIFGIVALQARSVNLLLVVLFLLAMQANFFSPAKYGILPEILDESGISRANGLVEFSTFAAIVLGTSAGTLMFARWKNQPFVIGGLLLAISILGSLTSLFIRKVPASGSREPIHINPIEEVWTGMQRIYQDRAQWLTVMGISYFWFLGALFQLTVILLGSESLHLTETRTGLLVTALALGIGAGSVFAGWLSGDHVEIGLVPLGAALLGFSSILLASAHTFSSAVLWLAAAGFSGGLFIVPLNAFLQERAEACEKGRVLATNSFLNAIGIVIASGCLYLLHDRLQWTPPTIFAGLGVMTLAATGYIAWLLPDALVRFAIWSATHFFFRVRIIGRENLPASGGALIVSNHVSYADAVLLGCATPRLIRFLMWQPLYQNKWLHPIGRLFKAIPLAQGSPKEALRALRQAHAELSSGNLVCIFPEGGLTKTGQVQPFERGLELIRRGLESTPVIPIYLDGLWGHALSLRGEPCASRLRPFHSVTIYIGKPITGEVESARLRERVLELGSEVPEFRKDASATLSRRFIRAARRNWSSKALADSTGKCLTFGESLAASLLIGDWLRKNRAGSEHIGILLPSSVVGALGNLGVTLAGKTAVNLNFTAGEDHIRQAVEKCAIQTILSSRQFLAKAALLELAGVVCLEDLLSTFTLVDKTCATIRARVAPARFLAPRTLPDDIAAIIFSSGSTGIPKGVMLSHWNLITNAEATGQVFSVGLNDCMLGALPFFHSFGYTYTLWFPLLHGFSAVYHTNPLDAKIIGELAGAHRPTLFLSTPTFCLGYLRKCTREQFASIRHLLVGAEKLRPALSEAFEKRFGLKLLEGYGCTEMGPAVSVNVLDACKVGSAGRLLPGVTARTVDPETFEPRTPGEAGLLLVKSPSRMVGYFGDEQRTAESLRDGYYVTGDLASVDSDGFLHIVDRLSRFSKIAGEMVPHLTIEESLAAVMGSGRCVVTGVPDERRGERLAVLYSGMSITPAEMIWHLESSNLPPLWIPKREQFFSVDSIPVLGTGKVDLVRVRAIAQERSLKAQPQSEVAQ